MLSNTLVVLPSVQNILQLKIWRDGGLLLEPSGLTVKFPMPFCICGQNLKSL